MNKKIMIAGFAAVALSLGAFAGPHRGFGGPHGGFHHPPPMHHSHGFHHGHSVWGRGGCNFWPGFVGGVVGGLVYDAVTTPYCRSSVVVASPTVVSAPAVVATPTVVTTPAVVAQPVVTQSVVAQPVVAQPVVTQPVVAQPVSQTQNVWVEGRYVDQVQDNGTVVRVWQPGHYEQRTVVVQ